MDALVICLEEFDPGVKEAAAWALGYIARHNAGIYFFLCKGARVKTQFSGLKWYTGRDRHGGVAGLLGLLENLELLEFSWNFIYPP